MGAESADRRQVLRRGAAVVCGTLAGCLQGGSDSDAVTSESTRATTAASTTTTTSRTTTTDDLLAVGETATVERGDVTVQDATAHLVVAVGGSDHVELVGERGAQYLAAAVKVSFGTPVNCVLEDPPLALFLSDARYDVSMACLYEREWDKNQGPMAFRVPRDVDFDAGRLAWIADDEPAVSWRLPDATVDRLRNPPAFAVRSFEVPGEAQAGATVEASFAVENTGDGPGEFVYQFDTGRTTRPDLGKVDVGAGERVTETREFEVYGEAGTRMTVTLNWGLGSKSRTLDVGGG
jgi:hypothetical protein